jgi:hypothetical protein
MASATVAGRIVVASAVVGTVVTRVAADNAPEADTVRGSFRATLDWRHLSDGHWMLHVLDSTGTVVEGGIGDDPEEALLEVYGRLIRPG